MIFGQPQVSSAAFLLRFLVVGVSANLSCTELLFDLFEGLWYNKHERVCKSDFNTTYL